MPKKIHGKKVNELDWRKAKAAARKQYNESEEPTKFYAVVMKIYNEMQRAKRKQ